MKIYIISMLLVILNINHSKMMIAKNQEKQLTKEILQLIRGKKYKELNKYFSKYITVHFPEHREWIDFKKSRKKIKSSELYYLFFDTIKAKKMMQLEPAYIEKIYHQQYRSFYELLFDKAIMIETCEHNCLKSKTHYKIKKITFRKKKFKQIISIYCNKKGCLISDIYLKYK